MQRELEERDEKYLTEIKSLNLIIEAEKQKADDTEARYQSREEEITAYKQEI